MATKPRNGISDPISKPNTRVAPIKPSSPPTHCFKVTFSPNIGPLKIFVRIGCKPTIRADNVADKPIEYEKKTPPR